MRKFPAFAGDGKIPAHALDGVIEKERIGNLIQLQRYLARRQNGTGRMVVTALCVIQSEAVRGSYPHAGRIYPPAPDDFRILLLKPHSPNPCFPSQRRCGLQGCGVICRTEFPTVFKASARDGQSQTGLELTTENVHNDLRRATNMADVWRKDDWQCQFMDKYIRRIQHKGPFVR